MKTICSGRNRSYSWGCGSFTFTIMSASANTVSASVAIRAPAATYASSLMAEPSRPAPLAAASRPAELRPASAVANTRVDPLQKDEVDAFKRALAAGVRGEQALAAASKAAPAAQAGGASYTLLTGFEDTEMVEGDQADLSGTQYGALR